MQAYFLITSVRIFDLAHDHWEGPSSLEKECLATWVHWGSKTCSKEIMLDCRVEAFCVARLIEL